MKKKGPGRPRAQDTGDLRLQRWGLCRAGEPSLSDTVCLHLVLPEREYNMGRTSPRSLTGRTSHVAEGPSVLTEPIHSLRMGWTSRAG